MFKVMEMTKMTMRTNQNTSTSQPSSGKRKTEAAPKATAEQPQKILGSIDLAGLTSKQKEMVRQAIKEGDVFPGDDDDIGDIRIHAMKINLKDDHPVQLNYNSVPGYLCNELKIYIEYLLKKQWIISSSSTYSSPVVAVRNGVEQ